VCRSHVHWMIVLSVGLVLSLACGLPALPGLPELPDIAGLPGREVAPAEEPGEEVEEPGPSATPARLAATPLRPATLALTKTGTTPAGPTPPPLPTPAGPAGTPGALNPNPPAGPVRLVFIHHSTGEAWLSDDGGGLAMALRDNRYYVSDTNYGWGPEDEDLGGPIGDYTDLGNWWNWFNGPHQADYLSALAWESGQYSEYSRLAKEPEGENEVILFKSCFPNSGLGGKPGDAPFRGANPLRGQDAGSDHMTVANAKGIYADLLPTFASRPDKLFVVITQPPLVKGDTSAAQAANARALATWLATDWLKGYAQSNVAVFDFFNVLTSSTGRTSANDLNSDKGNHHRFRSGKIEYLVDPAFGNFSAYASASDDSHPTPAGGKKATAEFIPLLNIAYHRWKGK
jgi:hypothetical protein